MNRKRKFGSKTLRSFRVSGSGDALRTAASMERSTSRVAIAGADDIRRDTSPVAELPHLHECIRDPAGRSPVAPICAIPSAAARTCTQPSRWNSLPACGAASSPRSQFLQRGQPRPHAAALILCSLPFDLFAAVRVRPPLALALQLRLLLAQAGAPHSPRRCSACACGSSAPAGGALPRAVAARLPRWRRSSSQPLLFDQRILASAFLPRAAMRACSLGCRIDRFGLGFRRRGPPQWAAGATTALSITSVPLIVERHRRRLAAREIDDVTNIVANSAGRATARP